MCDSKVVHQDFAPSKEDSPEMRSIKELTLVHLDLIQQQQELLMAKDRQIQSLRRERDTLRCRLERMERRMSLLRQKGDVDNIQRKLQEIQGSPSPLPSRSGHPHRGVKRKGSLEPQNLSKKFASAGSKGSVGRPEKNNSAAKVHFTPRKQWRKNKDLPPRSRSDSTGSEREMQQQIRTQPRRVKPSKYDSIVLVDSTQEIKNRLKPVVFPRNHKLNICYTDVMYYVPQNSNEPLEMSPKKPDKSKEEGVQVPTWRINPVPTGYQMEGTENLGDEIFLRRHQKPEMEEKRRKRWDMQRLREQSLYQRLHQTEDKDEKSETTPQSFLPDLDNVKYIEVSDHVPVSAFGYPIPDVKPSEFELPWFDLDKREKEEHKKSSRSKKR